MSSLNLLGAPEDATLRQVAMLDSCQGLRDKEETITAVSGEQLRSISHVCEQEEELTASRLQQETCKTCFLLFSQ